MLYRALTAIGAAPEGWAVRSVWAWESMSVVIRPLDIAAIWCRLMFLKKLYIGCARSPGKSLSRTAQPSAVSAICAMGSSSFDWLGAAAVWGATPSRARGSVGGGGDRRLRNGAQRLGLHGNRHQEND